MYMMYVYIYVLVYIHVHEYLIRYCHMLYLIHLLIIENVVLSLLVLVHRLYMTSYCLLVGCWFPVGSTVLKIYLEFQTDEEIDFGHSARQEVLQAIHRHPCRQSLDNALFQRSLRHQKQCNHA